ncbi:MAG: hypothetical protein H6849_04495 [Alphaproteobacteria bacterium]|nr:MAG: hypothetical protein H6849_04495 [Alphaproteobacteria bacterium]
MKTMHTLSRSFLLSSLVISTLCASSDPSLEAAAAPAGPARTPQEKAARLRKIDCILALSSPFLHPVIVDARHLPNPGSAAERGLLDVVNYRRLSLTNSFSAFAPGHETLLARASELRMTIRTQEDLERALNGLSAMEPGGALDTINIDLEIAYPGMVLPGGITCENIARILDSNLFNSVRNVNVEAYWILHDRREGNPIAIRSSNQKTSIKIDRRSGLLPTLNRACEEGGSLHGRNLSFKFSDFMGEFRDVRGYGIIPGIFDGAFGRQISSLDISRHHLSASLRLDPIAVTQFLEALKGLTNLRKLNLNYCSLGNTCFQGILGLPIMSTLEVLDMEGNNLSSEGITSLVGANPLPSLQSLNLSGFLLNTSVRNTLTTEAVAHLLCLLNPRSLKVVDLSRMKGSFQSLATSDAAPYLRTVKKLNLKASDVRDEDVQGIFHTMPSLESVDLVNNRIGDDGALGILAAINERRLPVKYIDLSRNYVSPEIAERLTATVESLQEQNPGLAINMSYQSPVAAAAGGSS